MPPTLGAGASSEQIERFEGKIGPPPGDHCHACRRERIETPFGGLRPESREAAINGGDSGLALAPGKPVRARSWQCHGESQCRCLPRDS